MKRKCVDDRIEGRRLEIQAKLQVSFSKVRAGKRGQGKHPCVIPEFILPLSLNS